LPLPGNVCAYSSRRWLGRYLKRAWRDGPHLDSDHFETPQYREILMKIDAADVEFDDFD
jgi:hypothetical protein